MTLNLQLSWWAQLILVLALTISLLAGSAYSIKFPEWIAPLVNRGAEGSPSAPDGWSPPAFFQGAP